MHVLLGADIPSGTYLGTGVFSISLGNLILMITMIIVFGLALILPFPRHREPVAPHRSVDGTSGTGAMHDE